MLTSKIATQRVVNYGNPEDTGILKGYENFKVKDSARIQEDENEKLINLTLEQLKDKHLNNPYNTSANVKKTNFIPIIGIGLVLYFILS